MYATDSYLRSLHLRHAPTKSALDAVYGHSTIVWEIASTIVESKKLNVDLSLLYAGCFVHDIGVYGFYDTQGQFKAEMPYVTHGVRGYEVLKHEGLPETICRFASCHTGVGLTKADIEKQKLPLPPKDYVALTPEEKLVMYADKFHSKTSPPVFNTVSWYEEYFANIGGDLSERFLRMVDEFGEPDIGTLAKRHKMAIRTL